MATLRQYVRHAELYGSYDVVLEEACSDLNPMELATLISRMREMSYTYKNSKGARRTERFKLPPAIRDAIAVRLLYAGSTPQRFASLLGCSVSHVRRLGSQGNDPGAKTYQRAGEPSLTL
jgi:hypothetical protein